MATFFKNALSKFLPLVLVFHFVLGSSQVLARESVSQFTEEELIQAVDEHTDEVLKHLSLFQPAVPMSKWLKMKNVAILALKHTQGLHDLVKASGPKVLKVTAATEVVTTGLGLALAGAGMPTVGMVFGLPWGFVAGLGTIGYEMMKLNRQVAKELGLSSLKELNILKEGVLGFEMKSRLSARIYKAVVNEVDHELEVQILSKAREGKSLSTQPAVTVLELEEIIRLKGGSVGANFLSFAMAKKAEQKEYASLLLAYIYENENLEESFMNFMNDRITKNLEKNPGHPAMSQLRRLLLDMDNSRKAAEQDMHSLLAQRNELKKTAKTLSSDRRKQIQETVFEKVKNLDFTSLTEIRRIFSPNEESETIKEEIKDRLIQIDAKLLKLHELKIAMTRSEYQLLHQAQYQVARDISSYENVPSSRLRSIMQRPGRLPSEIQVLNGEALKRSLEKKEYELTTFNQERRSILDSIHPVLVERSGLIGLGLAISAKRLRTRIPGACAMNLTPQLAY